MISKKDKYYSIEEVSVRTGLTLENLTDLHKEKGFGTQPLEDYPILWTEQDLKDIDSYIKKEILSSKSVVSIFDKDFKREDVKALESKVLERIEEMEKSQKSFQEEILSSFKKTQESLSYLELWAEELKDSIKNLQGNDVVRSKREPWGSNSDSEKKNKSSKPVLESPIASKEFFEKLGSIHLSPHTVRYAKKTTLDTMRRALEDYRRFVQEGQIQDPNLRDLNQVAKSFMDYLGSLHQRKTAPTITDFGIQFNAFNRFVRLAGLGVLEETQGLHLVADVKTGSKKPATRIWLEDELLKTKEKESANASR